MANVLQGCGYIAVKKGSSYPYEMRCLINFSQIELTISEEGGEDVKALRLGGTNQSLASTRNAFTTKIGVTMSAITVMTAAIAAADRRDTSNL